MEEDRAFMGIMRPDPPWGFDVVKYMALATKEVGNVGKSDVPKKEGQRLLQCYIGHACFSYNFVA
jgi:hypothetical protein